jgi:1-acyl-sn-glycerol-3-phosphate acyltransferase
VANAFSIGNIVKNMASWKVTIIDAILNIMPVLHIGAANRLVREHKHLKGVPFVQAVMKKLGITATVYGIENIPKTGAVTIVANHPGGADVLAALLALSNVRSDFSILANHLICIDPVEEFVIPVNTMARQKVDANQIHEAYKKGRIVVFFGAGKNSRYNEKGELRDRRWRTSYLDYAKQYDTPVLVMKISGANSPLFYKVSKFRERFEALKNVPLENMFQLREFLTFKGNVNFFVSKPIFLKNNDNLATKSKHSSRGVADAMYNFLYDEMDIDKLEFKTNFTNETHSESNSN